MTGEIFNGVWMWMMVTITLSIINVFYAKESKSAANFTKIFSLLLILHTNIFHTNIIHTNIIHTNIFITE